MGKYEKVLYKAIRYTEDDETKKEPVPYVFMSMAFFKISESSDAELLLKYSKALKDALEVRVEVCEERQGSRIH